MNKSIKYIVENLFDDFYDDQQYDMIEDFLGYKYFPKTTFELQIIIKEHYKNNNYNLNDIDVSKITDLSYLFRNDYCTYDEKFNISNWNVSNVENFSGMFYDCEKFNCDLSKWDVSNSVNFSDMFWNCNEFNSDLRNWKVHKCKDFSAMFNRCHKFNSDLSDWDVSNGNNFTMMFSNCHNFNSDLSNWNIKDKSYICEMFYNCSIDDKYKPKGIK